MKGQRGERSVEKGGVRADSLTMQCGTVCTLCISALIQLSLIDINLRVAKQRNVGRGVGGGGRGMKKAHPALAALKYAQYDIRGNSNTSCSSSAIDTFCDLVENISDYQMHNNSDCTPLFLSIISAPPARQMTFANANKAENNSNYSRCKQHCVGQNKHSPSPLLLGTSLVVNNSKVLEWLLFSFPFPFPICIYPPSHCIDKCLGLIALAAIYSPSHASHRIAFVAFVCHCSN